MVALQRVWISCRVQKGVFPGEYAVQITDAAERAIWLFADDQVVRTDALRLDDGESAPAELKVTLLDRAEHTATVVFPQMPLDGTSMACVPLTSLCGA